MAVLLPQPSAPVELKLPGGAEPQLRAAQRSVALPVELKLAWAE
jgi:hypothetical protein